jgi:hypothetical protein
MQIRKKKPHSDPKRVASRDPYQSIDLIEYYKNYDWHKEPGFLLTASIINGVITMKLKMK